MASSVSKLKSDSTCNFTSVICSIIKVLRKIFFFNNIDIERYSLILQHLRLNVQVSFINSVNAFENEIKQSCKL